MKLTCTVNGSSKEETVAKRINESHASQSVDTTGSQSLAFVMQKETAPP
jgi:hypothetical protein